MTDGGERRMYLRHDERHRLREVCDVLWRSRDRIEDDETDHLPVRDDERAALEPLLDAGYELLGKGIGRLVLRMPEKGGLDEFVVKVGRYGDDPASIGMWQNNAEVSLWNDLQGEGWPLLPALDWQEAHMRWVVMPHGTPLDDDSIDDARRSDLLDRGVERLSALDCIDDTELVPQNFVIWNDDVWLADYGSHSASIL